MNIKIHMYIICTCTYVCLVESCILCIIFKVNVYLYIDNSFGPGWQSVFLNFLNENRGMSGLMLIKFGLDRSSDNPFNLKN